VSDGLGIILPWLEDRTPRDLEAESAPLTLDRKRWCGHNRTRLDGEARRVWCRDCGEEVDAFTVLSGIAADTTRLITNRDHLRAQIASLEERVEEKKRELRSLTGKVRRRS
jgi:hypothetical protein